MQDVRTDATVIVPRRAVLTAVLAAIVVLDVANAWSIALGADTEASRYFLLSMERNPSTWLSAILLAVTGTAALAVGRGRPDASRWRLVGGLLWVLSLDEIATVHERLHALPGLPAIGTRGWAGAGLVLVALVAVRLGPWSLALERRLRFGLLAGGAVFVLGAVVFEILSGNRAVSHGTDGLHWALATVEENLELLGVVIVLRALLDHLAATGAPVTVAVVSR